MTLLREIFQKNGYPENFIDRCFKVFLNRTHILKVKVPTVEKKLLQLVLPYLGTISLQTRKKLQKSIKGVLTLKNYRLFSKVKLNSVITYSSKTRFIAHLKVSGWLCNYTWLYLIILSLITMVCRRAIYFIDLKIIEYYQKACG